MGYRVGLERTGLYTFAYMRNAADDGGLMNAADDGGLPAGGGGGPAWALGFQSVWFPADCHWRAVVAPTIFRCGDCMF